jgi:hypothetical protein
MAGCGEQELRPLVFIGAPGEPQVQGEGLLCLLFGGRHWLQHKADGRDGVGGDKDAVLGPALEKPLAVEAAVAIASGALQLNTRHFAAVLDGRRGGGGGVAEVGEVSQRWGCTLCP